MLLTLVQANVSRDAKANYHFIMEHLSKAQTDEWVVFPEGMLSGYAPEDDDYLTLLDASWIDAAITRIGAAAVSRRCRCIVGSATFRGERGATQSLFLTVAVKSQWPFMIK